MPTPISTDKIPMTGNGELEKISVLTYIEARIFALAERLDERINAADVRYGQRFDASNTALAAAMLAAEKAIQAALLSAEKAVAKAETASESRFASVNEFRKTLSDQTASFIPRAEADARFVSIGDKLDQLSSRMDKREGTGTGLSTGWAILVSVIGIIGTIVGLGTLAFKEPNQSATNAIISKLDTMQKQIDANTTRIINK